MAIVNTIHGAMDESLLVKEEGSIDNDNELTKWVEYRLQNELVHRSVHVHLKTNILADGVAAAIG